METWEAELRSTGRPEPLIQRLVATVAAAEAPYIAASASYLSSSFAVAPQQREVNRFTTFLQQATTSALQSIRSTARDVLASLADYALVRLARVVPGAEDLRVNLAIQAYVREVESFIRSRQNDLAAAANTFARRAIRDGQDVRMLRGQLAPLLEQARGHAATVVRTELQNASVRQLQQVYRDMAIGRVRRVVAATACPVCRALEGTYDITDPRAFEVPHPNCACDFMPESSPVGFAHALKLAGCSHG